MLIVTHSIEPERAAREARALFERALDRAGWPWSRGLSRWVDVLLTIEEKAQ